MRLILLPFGWLFGFFIRIRNIFYDKGWMRSFHFDFPIILVGNLSAGGTGKTPHVEYLIKALQHQYKVATLSRGYRRTMKGYGLATELSLVEDIGDEPKLYKQKYPATEVAVSENRVTGVYYLLNDEPDVQVIVMDDGFQHRRITAGFNILLTTWQQPWFKDHMLPAGNLREPIAGKKRAQAVIVTKCPDNLSNDQRVRFAAQLGLEQQPVFFTGLQYGNLYPLFIEQPDVTSPLKKAVILLTGIAGNKQLKTWAHDNFSEVSIASFGDHHYFTAADFKRVASSFPSVKTIITTEKDAMRLSEQKEMLLATGFSIFVLPVEVKFSADEHRFLDLIHNYIISNPPAEHQSPQA
jgi:tetraacyldisaccharide 4'-kinase